MKYAATIGFFDGVHLGHQYLLSRLQEEAKQRGLQSAIITFEQHPQEVLQGESPVLLTTYDERIDRLKNTGVDEIFCFNFELIHTMSADAFAQLLHDRCGVEMLLMGYDHRFGCATKATGDGLQAAGQALNSNHQPLELVRLNERPGNRHISSTLIRSALGGGRVVEANEMLGYAYALTGTVVHGKAIGRTIGFPTANIEVEKSKLIPAPGVYQAEWQNRRVLLNIKDTIEMYVPDYEGDLYGKTVTVSLTDCIRGEQHFDTLEELKKQIQKDLLTIQ